MCHVARQLAPGYFNGGRHVPSVSLKESVLVLRHYGVI